MAKKALETLSETMFYTLMALTREEMCGTEAAEYVRRLTDGRVHMGPGTLYTILANFQSEGLIEKRREEGRRITYGITEKGRTVFASELERLRLCLRDAALAEGDAHHETDDLAAAAL